MRETENLMNTVHFILKINLNISAEVRIQNHCINLR